MDEKNATSGFREVEHTADWELEVWAQDMADLLVETARGMYQLTDVRLKDEPRVTRQVKLEFVDRESLLVDFLSELLFFSETEHIGFDRFNVNLEEKFLEATLEGAPIHSQKKEIKAVTYHRLEVRDTQRGLEVNVVFDV